MQIAKDALTITIIRLDLALTGNVKSCCEVILCYQLLLNSAFIKSRARKSQCRQQASQGGRPCLLLPQHSTMALPRAHQQAFTPREIEFLAGHEEITVIPTHRMPRLDLIEVYDYQSFWKHQTDRCWSPGILRSISAATESQSTTMARTHDEEE